MREASLGRAARSFVYGAKASLALTTIRTPPAGAVVQIDTLEFTGSVNSQIRLYNDSNLRMTEIAGSSPETTVAESIGNQTQNLTNPWPSPGQPLKFDVDNPGGAPYHLKIRTSLV